MDTFVNIGRIIFKKKIMSTWTKRGPCMYPMWTLVDIFLTMYVCLSVHVVCECPLNELGEIDFEASIKIDYHD